jgi:hypothetical protein
MLLNKILVQQTLKITHLIGTVLKPLLERIKLITQ